MTAELRHLLESGEYGRCLERGCELLRVGLPTASERVRILTLLCRCHVAMGDLPAAVRTGESAATLARRLRLSDLEGAALLDLATAQARSRQHGAALRSLDRFRRNLHRYTASRVLEGATLKLTAEVLCQIGRPAEAVDWFQRAVQWFERYGDTQSAEESLMGRLEAYRLAGRMQESVEEAFRALQAAEPLSPLQVRAQLHLSRMAEAFGRPVEALSFALAARVSAIDGRLYPLEFEAATLLAGLVCRFGSEPVAELAVELERQGVDLYHYLDLKSVNRLARGE